MTDFSKRVDMGGDDVIFNSIMYSSTPGGSVARVIDVNGPTPTVNSTTAGTLTFAMMLSGMYCATNAAATTITLDTAANIVAGLNTSYSSTSWRYYCIYYCCFSRWCWYSDNRYW